MPSFVIVVLSVLLSPFGLSAGSVQEQKTMRGTIRILRF